VRDATLKFASEQFPLKNNLPPHSLHGTVFDRPWNVVKNSSSEVVLEIDLGDEWPFAGTVQHHIQLTDTKLEMQLEVHAIDAMPIQVGWHPWFVKPTDTALRFAAMLQRDSAGIATEIRVSQPTIPVDDCFVEPENTLTITIENVQVTLSSDCSHWVLYDEPLNATCVEPQSGPPNGINDDPLQLAPNTSMTRKFTIEVQQIT
jgi:aldose 1-epimerase